MRLAAFALSVAFVGFAASAWAAQDCGALIEQGCACAIDIASADGGPVALLTDIQGDVLKSEVGQYTPVSSPTELNVGDGVLTKANGQATVSAGPQCQLAIGPQTSVVIAESGGCGCVAMEGDWQTDPIVTGATNDDGGGLAALFAVGGVGGIIALIKLLPPVSP